MGWFASLEVPFRTCVCVGISAMLSVWACSPPFSPSVWPEPTWIGVLLRRSGRAKFTCPSPPKVVPSNENSAWFWLIGRSWPLHKAQPFGANTKLMIRISLKNGYAIVVPFLSVLPVTHGHLDYGGVRSGPAINATPGLALALPVFVLCNCAVAVALAGGVSTNWAVAPESSS